jgi:hypothetical protein
MADPTPTPTDQTGPLDAGSTTSEFTAAKWAMILTIVSTVVGAVSEVLTQLAPQLASFKWYGAVLAVIGLLGTVLTALGYGKNRTALKIAALK